MCLRDGRASTLHYSQRRKVHANPKIVLTFAKAKAKILLVAIKVFKEVPTGAFLIPALLMELFCGSA